MHCIKKVTADLIWVGADDRRLAMFEGVYSVPGGVSYNSYLLLDEKTVLFDTVDKAVSRRFLENLAFALGGRPLDYFIVQHMEPDHSAALEDIIIRYPNAKLVCNAKTLTFIQQFTNLDIDAHLVKEGDTLHTGRHSLHFVNAPMVHWPEVMVTYDSTDKILFSADAFGTFGALNGALFADEVDFEKDYMDEARRYYTNIVGKYGTQVQSLLKKASALEIEMICPLHGFLWRKNLSAIISKYHLWCTYQPESKGVMIAYASVYGNTENAAEILACLLREKGIKTVMYDVSVTPASEIIAAAFKWSHLVFASTTYNAGIFVSMEALLDDLTAHNIQNRTAALIENGSWAAASGSLMREKLNKCKNIIILEQTVSIKSALKAAQMADLETMAVAIATDFTHPVQNIPIQNSFIQNSPAQNSSVHNNPVQNNSVQNNPIQNNENTTIAINAINPLAMFKLSYGLFVLTAKDGSKDNGCIINTAIQITDKPLRISIAVNKSNHTHDMIIATGMFNLSVLTESTPFRIIEQFGFKSGRSTEKFEGCGYDERTENGIRYVPTNTNAVISAKVTEHYDYGTHTVFVANVTQSFTLSNEPSVTYQYYFDNIKPKPQTPQEGKKGFVCKICAYIYEGEQLPEGYVCPLCKHGVLDFEPV